VALVVWFGRSIHDFLLPAADTVTVPAFTGQTAPDAQNEIARLKLKSTIASHASSNQYPKGVVMNQQPEAGLHVRQGRQISLVISDGVQTYQMPDLRYQSLREAGLDLSRERLQLSKTVYVRSDDIPPDHIIDQQPAPQVNVTEGTQVTLTVSEGGAAQIKTPGFSGMSVDEARALAQRMHIHLGQIVWIPLGRGGPSHGTITNQRPGAGEMLGPYDAVSLEASAGPNESGYILHQTHVLMAVPLPENLTPGQGLRIRLQVTDATGQYDAFNGYATPGQKFDFNVTTVGTSQVDMYVNNVLVGDDHLSREPPNAYGPPMPKSTP
ncbi:MAG: PASTA domain-containing protein, partial [Candidatus Eremiobacteraeota bacterium]|nr:PASTA domain-containing protein [Candidatus Eremiobacteraeota bacterium]